MALRDLYVELGGGEALPVYILSNDAYFMSAMSLEKLFNELVASRLLTLLNLLSVGGIKHLNKGNLKNRMFI